MRALVIDDSDVMRRMIKDILENAGYDVIELSSGHDAVSTYREFRPNIVTLDLIMPFLTGIDVLKKIIGIDSEARIIMISGLQQKRQVVESIEAGASDFLIKPFEEKELVSSVQKWSKSE